MTASINARRRWQFGLAVLGVLMGTPLAHGQMGAVFTSAGATNRSMAGASVAAPLSATGAVFWNPATTVALESSQVELGAELLYPQSKLSSSVPAGSLAPGFPPVTVAGSTWAENGVFPL